MKIITQISRFSFLLIFICISFASHSQSAKSEILDLLENQELAWNRGDIVGFMQGYWKNDSLKFIGKSGLSYGYEKVLSNYKKNYVDKDRMGKLHFEIQHLDLINSKYAIVIGSWSVERASDNPKGMFSLVIKKIKGEWKIILDHSS